MNRQKEISRNTHLTQEIIKENIVELEHPMLEAIRETKPVDYEDKIDKLNNTIYNLQLSINAFSFYQLPAIQSKEIHQGKTRTVSGLAITSQAEEVDSQQEVFSTPVTTTRKKTYTHNDFESNLNTYKDLLKEYKHTNPSTLFNDYTKKINIIELTKDKVKEELGMIIQSTLTNSRNHGGEMKGVRKGSNEHIELQWKIQYLEL